MAEKGNSALSAELEAAFAWWREAGVDSAFLDAPVNWITPPPEKDRAGAKSPPAVKAPARAPQPEPPALRTATLPQNLASFALWWLSEPILDEGRLAGRVAPRGEAGAEVMVIVPEPEREDADQLLAGPQGALLDAMLAAMGIAPEKAYVASALPRHTPMADWQAAEARGLGEVLRQHVHLATPKRLIAFGSNVLPLLGHDLPNSGQFSHQFNHEGRSIPLLAATDIGVLLVRPSAKARFWRQWLDWTGTIAT